MFIFQPRVHEDERGIFTQSFQASQTVAQSGFVFKTRQVNTSISKEGSMRGIHFKQFPPGQAKHLSVLSGSIIDVVIDLRKSSKTFLETQAFEINAGNRRSLLIGYGIGHAFIALESDTVVNYLCDSEYEPELEHSINPLKAGIPWEALSDLKENQFLISKRDAEAPGLDSADHLFFE